MRLGELVRPALISTEAPIRRSPALATIVVERVIDGVMVANQPGSTIKPFLYAFALENGFTPNDLLADVPTDFGTDEVYVPRNFDRRYHGPVTIRAALAKPD